MIIQRGNNHDDLEKSTGFNDWSFKGFILGQMGKEQEGGEKFLSRFFMPEGWDIILSLEVIVVYLAFSVFEEELYETLKTPLGTPVIYS